MSEEIPTAYGGAIRLTSETRPNRSKDGRTLMDKIFNPTQEEIAARKANETDDIEPAKGFKPTLYALRVPLGYEALQFTSENLAEMKAFVGDKGRVRRNHVDLLLDYYDHNNGMAYIGDYVVRDLDSNEWFAVEGDIFEQLYAEVVE